MTPLPPDKWTGLEAISATALLAETRPQAERAVRVAALYAANQTKLTLTGQRSGRAYRVSKTGPLHIASAPGEPPAVLFGNLRNSVGAGEAEWEGDTVQAAFGPGLGQPPSGGADPAETYARRLEWGGVDNRGIRILPRPYMEPTVLREQGNIEALLEREIAR